MTFKQASEKYFNSLSVQPHMLAEYRRNAEKHVYPKIGYLPVAEVSAGQSQQVLSGVRRKTAASSVPIFTPPRRTPRDIRTNPKGRPSQPTSLKRLRGVDKAGSTNDEPPVSGARPVPPDDLPESQRVTWERSAEELSHTKLWHRVDQDTVLAFTRWEDRHERAQRAVDCTGLLVKDPNGRAVLNPIFRAAAESAVRMQALARELGLTPQRVPRCARR
jgi:P27 family predicted phage terminase small subunit